MPRPEHCELRAKMLHQALPRKTFADARLELRINGCESLVFFHDAGVYQRRGIRQCAGRESRIQARGSIRLGMQPVSKLIVEYPRSEFALTPPHRGATVKLYLLPSRNPQ
jgi:hypothetical protein